MMAYEIAHLNFQNGGNVSRSTITVNHVMDARFELQYKTVELRSYNEAVFFLFKATLLCINGSWVHTGSLRQHGQENKVIITLQLSMSIATMEEEIVGVSVRLNQAMRQRFPKHRHA